MLDFVVQELVATADWRTVLEAYRSHDRLRKDANPESESWVPRLAGIEGVAPASLSQLHGKLIAVGFLKFEVSGSKGGMQYQVTPLGRQTLDRGLAAGIEAENSTASTESDHDE